MTHEASILRPTHQYLLHDTSRRAQIASGILLAVSVIAIGIIGALHPQIGSVVFEVSVLGVVGGAGLITFVIASCALCRANRKEKEAQEQAKVLENLKLLEEGAPETDRSYLEDTDNLGDAPDDAIVDEPDSLSSETPTSSTQTPSKKKSSAAAGFPANDFIKKISTEILPPILEALREGIIALINADARISGKDAKNAALAAGAAIRAARGFIERQISKPELHIAELLSNFGRGKVSLDKALICVFAAHNSQNVQKYEEAVRYYNIIASGNNFSDIQQALNARDVDLDALYSQFPQMLENHFCLDNEPLKSLGMEVLNRIFAGTPTKNVRKALTALRNRKKDFVEETEKFIQLVFKEARLDSKTLVEFNNRLIEHSLETQMMKSIRYILMLVSQNMRSLKQMLGTADKATLYPALNQTLLLSISHEYILNPELQKELMALQCNINASLKENQRFYFLIFSSREEAARDRRFADLPKAEPSVYKKQAAAVREFEHTHHVVLVPVKIALADHPMKDFKEWEGTLSTLGGALNFFGALDGILDKLKNYLKDNTLSQVAEVLPNFSAQELEELKTLFDALITPLLGPIYNGAIGNTSFRQPFREVISRQGDMLANELEQLANDPGLSFETLRDTGCRAIAELAEQFNEINASSH